MSPSLTEAAGPDDPAERDALRQRIADLEARLAESEETLEAIRSGEVDAVVVGEDEERRVFTLESADRPYRLLVEEMREGAITLSAEGIVLYCNQAFADLLDTPASQVVGARLKQFIVDSVEPLDPVIEVGGRTEVTLRSVNGEARSASLSLSPLPTDEGRLMCGVVADLTETRAHARDLADAQQSLAVAIARQESEERYRGLFNSIDSGFCIIKLAYDPAGRATDYQIVEANPAFDRQSNLVGAVGRWMSEIAPGLEQHWLETFSQVAITGEPTRREDHSAVFDDRWYEIYAYRVGQPEEQQVAVLFNDISERRRSEAAINELNEALQLRVAERTDERDRLWTLSQDMLARADYAGSMSAVNPAWTRILGWSERKLLTTGYAEFMHPEDAATTLAAIAEMERTGLPTRFQNRILTANEGWKPIDWTVAPEPDGTNFIAVGRDLTEDRERERELQLAQDALRQSQKMEAMGQLTGGVAHDFNNLLTPIIGSLDMLQRREIGGDREQKLIAGALQSADRAKTLVQRLLAFARRQPLKSTAVDLRALLEEMAELAASTSGPQIKIVVHAPHDLEPACADPNQLEMAILNLAVNARDAMPDGGTLTLSAHNAQIDDGHRSKLPPGSYVAVSVADTGFGMDDATMKRAVEPFFSTKGIGKGTGLGLSMVHGLASQLGGAMTLQSKPGLGTKIELWLPISAKAAELRSECVDPQPSVAGAGIVLLVDDEATVRTSTADMLLDLGYEVVEAASAREALKLLEGGLRADLLLTDHLMPGMTGTELARVARERMPGVPVLLISGFAEAEGVAPDLPRLTKPFRQAELASMLSTLG